MFMVVINYRCLLNFLIGKSFCIQLSSNISKTLSIETAETVAVAVVVKRKLWKGHVKIMFEGRDCVKKPRKNIGY